ncbi:MAG: SBBP repeat-containing protein [Bacteroidetes bacterium]|jgi:hypothetical protein|nr:SBBP repeat-containing protein [Bacteroidota bacterium]
MKKIKRILTSAIAMVCIAGSTNAQTWNWAKTMGGSDVDYATGIANDDAGNVYMVGNFKGTATFGDKQLTSKGYYDIFLAKYDTSGKLLWIQQAGGSDLDEANGIALDKDGSIYITGYFSSNSNFGGINIQSGGDKDFFLAKYDNNGNIKWIQTSEGINSEYGKALALDHKGNILVTGIFEKEIKIKSNQIKSKGATDIFVASYSTDGSLNWLKTMGGNGKDEATSIAADANGNAIITGWFSGNAEFGKVSLLSSGDDDIFVAKVNPSGNVMWCVQAGGSEGADRAYGVVTDPLNNIYVTGSFIGSAKFADQIIKSVGADDYFLAKYNDKGELAWVKSSGGRGGEIGRAISLDKAGNIYVCGDYNSTFAANSNSSSYSDWDIFIVKYNSKGIAVSANSAGGDGYDRPIAMSIDNNNNCYITGVYERNCFFGKQEIVSNGNSDIFIAKTNYFEPLRKN